MPTANGARVSPARVALPASAGAMLSFWRLLCPGVALLDELPPPRVWCGKSFGTTTVEPDVVLAAGVAATDDHLSPSAVENLHGFTLVAITCMLGVDLELEAVELRGLLRCELELKLQPVGVTTTANDEGARKRIQAEVADAIDSGCAINVDGDDPTVFWTSA